MKCEQCKNKISRSYWYRDKTICLKCLQEIEKNNDEFDLRNLIKIRGKKWAEKIIETIKK
jgi:hypothetical protein